MIRTEIELGRFFAQIRAQKIWNEPSEFIDAIRQAKLDFGNEALVLIRHTEGSGSNQVRFRPRVIGRTMKCDIWRRKAYVRTADWACYCTAFAVSKELVDRVLITKNSDPVAELAINDG